MNWHAIKIHAIVGGKECCFDSKFEYKVALLFEAWKALGVLDDWEHHSQTFEFKERCRTRKQYTPDFRIYENINGAVVSTWVEATAAITQLHVRRLKLMSKDFPDDKFMLVLPCGTKSMRKSIIIDSARKYIERILYANPEFKRLGIK